jgi:hypothetical protein
MKLNAEETAKFVRENAAKVVYALGNWVEVASPLASLQKSTRPIARLRIHSAHSERQTGRARSQGEILFQNYRSIRSIDESAREIQSTARAVSRIADFVRLDCLDCNLNAWTRWAVSVNQPG